MRPNVADISRGVGDSELVPYLPDKACVKSFWESLVFNYSGTNQLNITTLIIRQI